MALPPDMPMLFHLRSRRRKPLFRASMAPIAAPPAGLTLLFRVPGLGFRCRCYLGFDPWCLSVMGLRYLPLPRPISVRDAPFRFSSSGFRVQNLVLRRSGAPVVAEVELGERRVVRQRLAQGLDPRLKRADAVPLEAQNLETVSLCAAVGCSGLPDPSAI